MDEKSECVGTDAEILSSLKILKLNCCQRTNARERKFKAVITVINFNMENSLNDQLYFCKLVHIDLILEVIEYERKFL